MKKLSGWMIFLIIFLIVNIIIFIKYLCKFMDMIPNCNDLKAKGHDANLDDTAPDGIVILSDGSEVSAKEITSFYTAYTELMVFVVMYVPVIILLSIILFILYKNCPSK
jgi:hypothetical protein